MNARMLSICSLSLVLLLSIACEPADPGAAEAALEAAGAQEATVEAAPQAEAQEVVDYVTAWIEERSEDGTFDIPARGGHDLSGSLDQLHQVYFNTGSTYIVAADFNDDGQVYEVAFLVDRTMRGLDVVEHSLQSVDGEEVTD